LRMSTPRNILSRASTENFTSLAAISVSPEKQLSFSLRHRRACPRDLRLAWHRGARFIGMAGTGP
jgi:hypothetical protein